MSKRKTNKSATQERSRALYVYCIGERRELAPLLNGRLPEAIESDAQLELIAEADLAAIASAVPLAGYGEQSLRARLGDPAWTALRAMRHEKVVEYFASRATVIPLRFGTIYLRRERIGQMISERSGELRAIIERLGGREEWGVNVYRDRAKLMEAIVSLSPRLSRLAKQAASASPGQAYLLRKKIEAMKADEARVETRRAVASVERELANLSEGATALRVMKDEATEQGEVIAKLAFLVEQTRFGEFRAAAEALAERHAAAGFKLELTGPWPAYNFADKTIEAQRHGEDTESI